MCETWDSMYFIMCEPREPFPHDQTAALEGSSACTIGFSPLNSVTERAYII